MDLAPPSNGRARSTPGPICNHLFLLTRPMGEWERTTDSRPAAPWRKDRARIRVNLQGAAMSMTKASSRAIDSAAPPLHSAAPVAARGSRRSSVSSGPLARSRNVDGYFDEHPLVVQAAYVSGKQIALPPAPKAQSDLLLSRAGVGLVTSSVSRLGGRCRHGRPGSACS